MENTYMPGSFGAYVADLPIGTELRSISGRTAVWLGIVGEYLGQPSGFMYETRGPAPRVVKIWMDGRDAPGVISHPGNCWTVTGRLMPEMLIPVAIQFVEAVRAMDEAEKAYETACRAPLFGNN